MVLSRWVVDWSLPVNRIHCDWGSYSQTCPVYGTPAGSQHIVLSFYSSIIFAVSVRLPHACLFFLPGKTPGFLIAQACLQTTALSPGLLPSLCFRLLVTLWVISSDLPSSLLILFSCF